MLNKTLNLKINTYFKRVPDFFWIYLFFIWFFFMALAVFTNYYHGFVKSRSFPFNSFVPAPGFGDFSLAMSEWIAFNGFGGIGWGVSYFPATYILLNSILYIMSSNFTLSLFFSLSFWYLGGSLLIYKFLKKFGFLQFLIIFCLVILSYPSMLIFVTGNLESWIAILLLFAAVSAYQLNWNFFAICIGIAGAMKGVPLIFILLPLFLLGKKSGAIVALKTLIISSALTIFSLIFLPNGFLDSGLSGVGRAITGIQASQEKYTDLMVNSIAGVHYGHSFLNAIHSLFGMETMPSNFWGPIIFWLLIILLLVLLYLQRVSGVEQWVSILAIGAVACSAVATSTDYKLIYLAPALLLATKSNLSGKFQKLLLILTVFAMVPKPWLYTGIDPWTNATVYLTSATLLTILIICYIQAIYLIRSRSVVKS